MEKNYSVELANAITAFLEEDHRYYRFDQKQGVYHIGFHLKSALDHVDVRIHVYDDSFSVNAISPINVKKDPARRNEMAEFICRANYGLRFGGFQYDIRDGEILYKTSMFCQGMIPSQEILKHYLYMAVMTFDKYSEGILSVLFGGATAREGIAACEDDTTSKLMNAFEAAAEGEEVDVDSLGEILTELSASLGIPVRNDNDGNDDEDDEE